MAQGVAIDLGPGQALSENMWILERKLVLICLGYALYANRVFENYLTIIVKYLQHNCSRILK